MGRSFFTLALILAFVLPAPAEPDSASSPRVSGGASKSVGEKPKDEEKCPGECEDPEDGPSFEDDDCEETPHVPMLWNFSSEKKSCLESVRKLFKDFPGEVKLGDIKKVKGEYEMEVRTFAKTGKDEEKFSEKMEKVTEKVDDISWGCRPDEKRMKELEAAKKNQEAPQKKESGKEPDPESGECPEPKK